MPDEQRLDVFGWLRAVLAPECTLDPLERLVVVVLVSRFANEQGCAWPGFAALCAASGISRSKLVAALAELERRGLFVREAQRRGRGLGTNTYRLPLRPPTSALCEPVAPRTSAPHALGSAPETLGVVRQADGGSAPGAPYQPRDQPSGTTQEQQRPPRTSPPHAPPTNRTEALKYPVNQRAELLAARPDLAQWVQPQTWPELRAVARTLHQLAGRSGEPKLGGMNVDTGVRKLVELFAAGYSEAELVDACERLSHQRIWLENPEKRTLGLLSFEVVRKAEGGGANGLTAEQRAELAAALGQEATS